MVKAETQRQVQAQADDVVDELGKQCQTSLMLFEQDQKQRIASQRQTLRDLNQEIKETQLKLEKSNLTTDNYHYCYGDGDYHATGDLEAINVGYCTDGAARIRP